MKITAPLGYHRRDDDLPAALRKKICATCGQPSGSGGWNNAGGWDCLDCALKKWKKQKTTEAQP